MNNLLFGLTKQFLGIVLILEARNDNKTSKKDLSSWN